MYVLQDTGLFNQNYGTLLGPSLANVAKSRFLLKFENLFLRSRNIKLFRGIIYILYLLALNSKVLKQCIVSLTYVWVSCLFV